MLAKKDGSSSIHHPGEGHIIASLLHDIYTCHMLQTFFKAFESTGYAVLSRKLEICLSGRRYEKLGKFENYGISELFDDFKLKGF